MAEGCYKDPYIPASYKGVPFEAMEVSTEVGRRIAKGEFPFSEMTATEDMGRRMRSYRISARFVGNDHTFAAAALLTVCESIGTGILIHPTLGALLVKCESATLKDNPLEDQGISTIEMNFLEAEDWSNGMLFGSSIFTIALNVIFAAVETTFYQRYEPSSSQFYYISDVLQTSSTAVKAVEDEFNRVTIGSTEFKVYSASAQIDNVRTDEGLLSDEKTLWQTLSLGMAAVYKYAAPENRFMSFRNIANAVAFKSSLSESAGVSQDAVYSATRIMAASYMARSLTEVQPSSTSSALLEYDIVMTVLEQEYTLVRETCDPAMQMTLKDFMTQVEKALLYRAYSVPPTILYNFSTGVHALVAAYEIYGDAKRVRDIVSRNENEAPYNMGPIISATL